MKLCLIARAPSSLLLTGAANAGSTMNVLPDYASIQAAVSAAQPGDSVVVSAGSYRENVILTTSSITLGGRKVTIDGACAGTCLAVQADDVTVTGITFANGGSLTAEGAQGGGLDHVGTGANISQCVARVCADFGIKLTGTGDTSDSLITGCLGPGWTERWPGRTRRPRGVDSSRGRRRFRGAARPGAADVPRHCGTAALRRDGAPRRPVTAS